MSLDRDKLREALLDYPPVDYPTSTRHGLGAIVEAARLVAEGREVWWCEAHLSNASSDHAESGNPCWFMMFAYRGRDDFGADHLLCRMVRMILIDGSE